MTVLSKNCKACQPKRKKWDTMSPNQLRKIQAEGAHLHGTTEYRLEKLIDAAENKDVDANRSRSLTLRRRHAKKVCSETVNFIAATVRRIQVRLANKKQHPAKLKYFEVLLHYALRTREHIKADISMGRYEPWRKPPKTFMDYLTQGEKDELKKLFDDMPEDVRSRTRKIY